MCEFLVKTNDEHKKEPQTKWKKFSFTTNEKKNNRSKNKHQNSMRNEKTEQKKKMNINSQRKNVETFSISNALLNKYNCYIDNR